MRSDAVRRRETIVRAARHLFAAHGAAVPLEAVAETAGVGIATLYRNFESRSALADAVSLAILAEMEQAASEALAQMAGRPAAAWHDFLVRLVELELGALTDALALLVAEDLSEEVRTAQDRTLAEVSALLEAARTAGLVRAELDALELVLAIGMITRPVPPALRALTPKLVPRLVTVFAAGLATAKPQSRKMSG
ncbi:MULTISPECIES: TetR/AcrR family transcriptional regulator [Microbacterium]|uniref:Regulatory protein, tetR family n=1 Tax=Microbacterium saccharophilum TaxID=1213358 RepID=A0A7Z7CXP1_9MICO|nr:MULTISPECIES: TetR/AcrR family transcriptional regulator [Microbacterium]SFI48552.1 regulatory protein, tetR family [Microbacterium saccharophilum]